MPAKRPRTYVQLFRDLGVNLGYIEVLAEAAKDVRRSTLGEGSIDMGTASETAINALTVLDRMVPTFLLVKLSTFLEEFIDKLWQRRFPSIKPRSVRAGDKLIVLAEVLAFNPDVLQQLRKLRNECAHNIDNEATWEDFEKHLKEVKTLIKTLQSKYRVKRLLRTLVSRA